MTSLPPPCPPVPALRATADALGATRSVRLGTALLSDVHDDAVRHGALGEGAGDAHDAAEESVRGFARHTDLAVAALEVVVRGLEAFEHDVAGLLVRRTGLVEATSVLDADVRAAALAVPDPLVAARLWDRHRALVDDLVRLVSDELDAEDALLRSLLSVDTEQEAAGRADDPDRPDAGALAGALGVVLGRPDDVRDWWAGLTAAEREALVVADPDLVVDADGLPVAARDDAGRTALARDLRGAEGRELGLLEALAAALALGGGAGLLLRYDRRGDGRGAVAYGDPDTADRTAVLVPGFGTDLGSIEGLGRRALDVQEEAQEDGGSVAAVAWVGYDAPDLTIEEPADLLDAAAVLDDRAARAGARELVELVDGLRASDSGDPSRVTVLGHSYGSTTTALAASSGLDADAVVLLGSPGAGDAHDAGELRGAGGDTEVYVGSQDRDPVTWLGGGGPGLGPDPAQADFGATRIDVGEGRSFHAGQLGSIGFADNHASYYEPGSAALDRLGDVVRGDPPEVVPGRDVPARDLLRGWLRDEADHQLEQAGDRLTELGDRLTWWD